MGTNIDITKLHYSDPRFKLYNNLQSDVARFATYREARRQKDLAAAPDAATRLKIEKRYAEWLKTEKQGAFANAAAAAKWTKFAENADLYPNLQYRTARDKDVRPEHARLEGLILPINDPFWSTHYPPLGFGCRCYVTQTDKAVVRSENYLETKAETGFDFNPGIEQKIFSDSAGYYKGWPFEQKKQLDKQAELVAYKISKKSVIDIVKEHPKQYVLENHNITLSGHDLRTILCKSHQNRVMRNMLLLDLKSVLENAVFLYSKVEGKGREQYKAWHYYQVKGVDNMFLNIAEMADETMKLHAITDHVQ